MLTKVFPSTSRSALVRSIYYRSLSTQHTALDFKQTIARIGELSGSKIQLDLQPVSETLKICGIN
jgi:hypothetical protein